MNAQLTPIEKYALLELQIDRMKAAGKAVPNDVANEFQSLAARAATLTPAQQAQALQYVRAAQREILDSERSVVNTISTARQESQQNLSDALRNAGARQVSRVARTGRDGKALDEGQLGEALQKGKYTDPGRVHALDLAAKRVQKSTGLPTTRDDVKRSLGTFGALLDDGRAMDKYLTQRCGDDEVERAALRESIEETYLRETLLRRQDNALMKCNPELFEPKVITTQRRRTAAAGRGRSRDGSLRSRVLRGPDQ